MATIKNVQDEQFIGLIKQLPCGRIVQIGMTAEQQQMIQMTLAALSKEKPMVYMPSKYDLVLKAEAQS